MTDSKPELAEEQSRREVLRTAGIAITGVAGFSGAAAANNHQNNKPQVNIQEVLVNGVTITGIRIEVLNVDADLENVLNENNVQVFIQGNEVDVEALTFEDTTVVLFDVADVTITDSLDNVSVTVNVLGDTDTTQLDLS